MNYGSIDIPDSLLCEWNNITALIAEFCEVPACLIMNCHGDTIEVKATTESPDNPYKHGDAEKMAGKLYCETVIEQQTPLHVPDALADPDWCDNPDIKLGMIMYYGVPINWPDDTPFGTLCILDRDKKVVQSLEKRLIHHFARLIEANLELLVKNHELEHAAGRDYLTGLFNRRMMQEILAKELATSHRLEIGLGVIYLDVDDFKLINDQLGHAQGDQVLIALAEIINQHMRRGDYVYRYGGEEFVISMLDVDRQEAFDISERLRNNIASQLQARLQINYPVTASLGVAILQPEDTLYTLLCRADQLMDQAKSEGKNRVVIDMDSAQGGLMATG